MVDPVTARRMGYWTLFLLIWLAVMFVWLLPIDTVGGNWPGANWTMLFAFAWVLRRPNFIPVFLVAIVILLDDMVFMRPPGLMAGLTVIGLEFLRSRAKFSRELPFLFEWALVGGIIFAVMAVNWLVLGLFAITKPNLALYGLYFVITATVYPVVVLISTQLMAVRHLPAGAVDQRGEPYE